MRFIIYTLLFTSFANLWAKPLKIAGEGFTATQKYIYLFDCVGEELFVRDSTTLSKGNFQFKMETDTTPKGIYAVGLSSANAIQLVVNTEDVLITQQGNKLKVSQGNDSQEMQKYFHHLKEYDETLMQIDARYREILPLQQIDPQGFQQKFELLRQSVDSLNTARIQFFNNLHQNTSSAFTRKVTSLFLIDENTSKLNFFKSTDFTDVELERGLILEKKINMYFMFFVNISAQNIANEFSALISLAPKTSIARKITYASLVKIAAAVDQEYSRSLYKSMKTEYGDDAFVKRIGQYVPKGAPSIGDMAPDIVLPDVNGKIIKLSDLRGKIVLIDFWASWCGPCRMEMPNVVDAYNKYSNKGFTVYSVALDSEKARWLNAIQSDGMVWASHVSELKKWDSSAARDYFVTGIPATFLIDANGVIVGKNLRGQALHQKLAELIPN